MSLQTRPRYCCLFHACLTHNRFELDRFGRATLLGVYRWLVLSLLAYLLSHWAYLSTSPTSLPDWGQTAQIAIQSLLPHLVLMLLLLEIERLRPLAKRGNWTFKFLGARYELYQLFSEFGSKLAFYSYRPLFFVTTNAVYLAEIPGKGIVKK